MSSFPSSIHRDILRKGQQSLNDVLPLIDVAEACGVDCQEYKQGEASLRNRINTYLTMFFPDQIIPGTPAGVPRHDG